jgi:hypothetical protein
MTSTTTNYAFRFPDESDSPDGATQTENLASDVDAQLAVTDAKVSANTTALTRPNLLATLLGSFTEQYTEPTAGVAAITSTTFVAVKDASGNVIAGCVFVAPPSGNVWIDYGMGVHTGDTTTVTVAVLTGGVLNSGTIVLAAADTHGFASTAAATVPGSHKIRVTGLTPGTTYNTFVLWRTSGGASSSAAHPYIGVTAGLT